MKQLFVILIFGMLTTVGAAQEKKNVNPNSMNQEMTHEYYMMKNNRVWHVQDSTSTLLSGDARLQQGAIITKTGEVITPDGKRETLSNGQCVDMSANVTSCENMRSPKTTHPMKK